MSPRSLRLARRICLLVTMTPLLLPPDAPGASDPATADSAEDWSLHFQYTGIRQHHGPFAALYSGRNSLSNSSESPCSATSTLFVGRRLWQGGVSSKGAF